MKFLDISGRLQTFELDRKYKLKTKEKCRSHRQYKIGKLLSKVYGENNVFEDYPLPGCGNVSWDFWVPHQQIAIEFHGEQHFEYIKFFHESKAGFANQQQSDKKKQKIADMNSVSLIVISNKDFITEDYTKWTLQQFKEILLKKMEQK